MNKRQSKLLDAREKLKDITVQNLGEQGKEWFWYLCNAQDRLNKEIKKSDDGRK